MSVSFLLGEFFILLFTSTSKSCGSFLRFLFYLSLMTKRKIKYLEYAEEEPCSWSESKTRFHDVNAGSCS